MWNSRGGGVEKILKTNSQWVEGSWNSREGWKSENFNSQGIGFWIAFLFPFLTRITTVLRAFVYTVKVK